MLLLQLYSACFAWALHWLVARLLLKGMNVPGVAWSELLAYTGYPFVLICFTTLGGFLAGTHSLCIPHDRVPRFTITELAAAVAAAASMARFRALGS
jgi:hypothetical protein